ncbi:hypothetical protein ACO1GT_08410, partial [Staphylococcus arlettae]
VNAAVNITFFIFFTLQLCFTHALVYQPDGKVSTYNTIKKEIKSVKRLLSLGLKNFIFLLFGYNYVL